MAASPIRIAVVAVATVLGAAGLWWNAAARDPLDSVVAPGPTPVADLVNRALVIVGDAAGKRRPVPAQADALMAQAARRDPLAPEPFLLAGAQAAAAGDNASAERLFGAARERDPRSAAAHYFLAARYFNTGRMAEGLDELAALTRLVPGADAQFAPAIAAFAPQDGAVPVLRRFFARAPQFADPTLSLLATDAANADLVVALAGGVPRGANAAAWQAMLVTNLIKAGDARRAQAVWRRLAGVAPYIGLFNPRFRPIAAPPPFNWSYEQGDGELVTPTVRGLDLVYFGRRDVDLAQQMVALVPGRYRLATRVDPSRGAGQLAWRIDCARSSKALLDQPLDREPGTFIVPPGCEMQRVRLVGVVGDSQRQVELAIREVTVSSEEAR